MRIGFNLMQSAFYSTLKAKYCTQLFTRKLGPHSVKHLFKTIVTDNPPFVVSFDPHNQKIISGDFNLTKIFALSTVGDWKRINEKEVQTLTTDYEEIEVPEETINKIKHLYESLPPSKKDAMDFHMRQTLNIGLSGLEMYMGLPESYPEHKELTCAVQEAFKQIDTDLKVRL